MKYVIGFLIALFVVLPFAISPLVAYGTKAETTFTVKEKERVCTGGQDGTCKYLIYTDNGVYENTDSLWYWKWSSSDIYGSLDAGKTYQATVYGFRAPFLSWYKNIIEVHAL